MKSKVLTSALCSAFALLGSAPSDAAITVFADHPVNRSRSARRPAPDSVGDTIYRCFSRGVTVGGLGLSRPTAFRTPECDQPGYYNVGNFSSLPNNNVAIGVYAVARPSGEYRNHLLGEGGGDDLSPSSNGWAGRSSMSPGSARRVGRPVLRC
jgi:hypothetical protein